MAAATDTRDHKIACLAKPLAERRAMMERMTKRHGGQFGEELKAAVTAEWEKRRGDRQRNKTRQEE